MIAMEEVREEESVYLRCRTCGEYFDCSAAVKEYYCSEECARSFARCNTCGAYFDLEEAQFEYFCSAECRDAYYTPAVSDEHLRMHQHEEEESLL